MNLVISDLRACLQFWSRLPVGRQADDFNDHEFSRAIYMLPLASLVIAAPATFILGAAYACGLSSFVAAALALAALTISTGGFHEDGLSDCADSLGVFDRERRLAVMKDSCVGAFGALAIVFSILLRVGALAALIDMSLAVALAAFLGLASFARVMSLLPLALLPPARAGGLGAGARIEGPYFLLAIIGAIACAALPICAGLAPQKLALAALLAAGGVLLTTRCARALYGGATGDVAGAAEQICEIIFLVTLSAHI